MKGRVHANMGGTIYKQILSTVWELHRARLRLEILWREKPEEKRGKRERSEG